MHIYLDYQQPTSIIIGNTRLVEPNNFVARLFGDDDFNNQLNIVAVTSTDAIQEALDAGLIELWEGSIYLHLSSFSPALILSILNGEGDGKLQQFLVKFLQENKRLLNYFKGKKSLNFSIRELPNHEFLGSSDGKFYYRLLFPRPYNKRAHLCHTHAASRSC